MKVEYTKYNNNLTPEVQNDISEILKDACTGRQSGYQGTRFRIFDEKGILKVLVK
jgi:hypothetical protein